MAGTLAKVHEIENLQRAWRWVRSNPDGAYKNHFRAGYSRYAIADAVFISDLQRRLAQGGFEPSPSCKLLLPKRSGILRPYTLLAIEDQIVYQAFVNIVAEQLLPRIRSRYLIQVFGHLYAGKTSQWFYRKWSEGYSKFNDSARDAFNRGLTFTASFDLTAYYDSLDHRVLRHFLANIGCEEEFCNQLLELLSQWTATEHNIFHGHGIPQGPLSSGLLSEVVLQHFDQHYGQHARLCYLRYVDDIRLFAPSESELRKLIVKLDMLSKDVGLFPQSAKIEIHAVKNIEDELKSVSNPPESAIKNRNVDQKRLRKRIVALSPRLKIENDTRFKFVLAHAVPHSILNRRLMRIQALRPDMYGVIGRYFQKYSTVPKSVGRWLVSEIKRDHLYPSVLSSLITTALGRLLGSQASASDRIVKALWRPNTLRPELCAAVGKWVITRGLLSPAQLAYALRVKSNWWPKSQLVESLTTDYYGRSQIETILNDSLGNRSVDVALAAAAAIVDLQMAITVPRSRINRLAGLFLREFGLLAAAPSGACGIEVSMSAICGPNTGLNWRMIFGADHRQAEKQAVWCKAYALTNATAFVNAMDVFNDLLLDRLYAHDRTLGTYTKGSIGSVLGSPRLRARYPHVAKMMNDIHDQRFQSHLSHPLVKRTGKPTKYIKFSYVKRARTLMRAAFSELATEW